MRKFVFLFLFFALSCATPPGKLTDSDFSWDEATIDAPYQEVYRRIVKGFMICPPQDLYFLERDLYTDISQGQFWVFSAGGFPGVHRGPFVIGKIFVDSLGPSTSKVRAGARGFFSEYPARSGNLVTSRWLKMALGDFSRCQ